MEHVATVDPVQCRDWLTILAVGANDGHPASRKRTLGALIRFTQFRVTLMTALLALRVFSPVRRPHVAVTAERAHIRPGTRPGRCSVGLDRPVFDGGDAATTIATRLPVLLVHASFRVWRPLRAAGQHIVSSASQLVLWGKIATAGNRCMRFLGHVDQKERSFLVHVKSQL